MAITITENRTFAYSSQTYNVQFFTDDIHTTVTADAAVVTDWINGIQPRRVLIVGLDAEWRPSFGSPQYNPVATLQLCVGNRCLIYQIIHSVWIPASLASFLSDSRQFGDVTFVGVGIKTDLEKLQRDYGIGGAARYVDLRRKAVEVCGEHLRAEGLKGLASAVLGKEVEKRKAVTCSLWDERWLTAEQVKYACVDAYLSFAIGMALGLGNYGEIGLIFSA